LAAQNPAKNPPQCGVISAQSHSPMNMRGVGT